MLNNGMKTAVGHCLRKTPGNPATALRAFPSSLCSQQTAAAALGCAQFSSLQPTITANCQSTNLPASYQQRRRTSASIAFPSGRIDAADGSCCPMRVPGRRLAEAVGAAAEIASKSFQKLMKSTSTTETATCPFAAASSSTTASYSKVPGPKGLPLVGSVMEYTALGRFSPKEFDKALRHRHNKYGKIFREKLMHEEFLYISDPKDIRVVVQNEGRTPCRPHLDAIVECRHQEKLPVGITALQGEEWLRNRNAINPAISPLKTVTKFRSAQKAVTDDFLAHMKRSRDLSSGEIPHFEQWLNRWALESIAVVLLDSRLGLLKQSEEKVDPAAEKLRECMDIFFDYGARLTFGVPTWKIFNTKAWGVFRQCQRDEFEYAGHFVDKKLNEMAKEDKNAPVDPDRPESLLKHVINNKSLTRDEALTVCIELLAGGIDTTASAAIFTLYHLSANPEHQEHLRRLLKAEADSTATDCCAAKENVLTSDFSKYLKACVWESVRLNPLTYANMRKTNKDLVLSGFDVPKGTTVRYTSHLMNLRDDRYFPQAEKFLPDRWLERKSPNRCTEQFTFTPFGHGARQCPGRRVAEQELDLLFRAVLENYKVEYNHGTMGTKVRLFNKADKPARFSFVPL